MKESNPEGSSSKEKTRVKTKARQCLVYKLNRRSTEAALIYSAICKAKAFRRLSGPLQTPSIVYKTNKNKPDDPQWSRQFVDEVNPLCGQRRSLLAQQGSSNKQTMLWRRLLVTNERFGIEIYLDSNARSEEEMSQSFSPGRSQFFHDLRGWTPAHRRNEQIHA